MTVRTPVILLTLACGLGAPGSRAGAGSGHETGILTVGAIATATVPSGGTTTVPVPVVVAEGFHVQANPASLEYLIPLELELRLAEPDSLVSWRPVYPDPVVWRLEGTEDSYLTYAGGFTVGVAVSPAPAAPPGERRFAGTLRYQACDRRRCYAPATVPVAFTMIVGE